MSPKTETNPKTTTTAAAAASNAPTSTDKKETKILSVSANIPMPEFATSTRGSTSKFPFDDLKPGESFGVIGRDLRSMSSIISAAEQRHAVEKKDENGAVVYKTRIVKDANGVENTVNTDKPMKVKKREFRAADVDPKTDPEGATVRVWRTK